MCCRKLPYLICLFISVQLTLFAFEYRVEFEGVDDKQILTTLKEGSTTVFLQDKKQIHSFAALRKRADSDLDKLKTVLHYYGYFSASIQAAIKREAKPKVIFTIATGPLYTIKICKVLPAANTQLATNLTLPDVEGMRANTENILALEEEILDTIQNQGYGLAILQKKEVIVDAATHTVTILLFINSGQLLQFGNTTIKGNTSVRDTRITQYMSWKRGDLYTPEKIEHTQQNLENSGLFSSVTITGDTNNITDNQIPMNISLQEAKHRSIAAGISYTTSKGPGVEGKWQHRNFCGRGDVFSFQADIWKRFQNIRMSLRQSHIYCYNQDCIWQVAFDHQAPLAYKSQTASISALIEHHFNPSREAFWGVKLETLHSKSIQENSFFYLAKLPFGIKLSSIDDPLDPLKGAIAQLKFIPAYQFRQSSFFYLTNLASLSTYFSVLENSLTIAAKVNFGSIVGANEHTIPTPDRLFSGTENNLRGYRYLTVSPLGRDHKPIGGRSLLTGTVELRFRNESGFGCVLFYDIGSVYKERLPDLRQRLISSAGIGLRYTTPLGPLRLDIAVPFNRRHKIDPPFQIYFSIGQSF